MGHFDSLSPKIRCKKKIPQNLTLSLFRHNSPLTGRKKIINFKDLSLAKKTIFLKCENPTLRFSKF